MTRLTVQAGLPEGASDKASSLYWEAFGGKLGLVMGPRTKGIEFIRRVIDPSHAISVTDTSGALLGVVGFKTSKGALVGGGFKDLAAVYGLFGAAWRGTLLSLLDRDTENQRFLLDGIFVAPEARGCGIGSMLLDAIATEARLRGYYSLRLDVINTNPRAAALYARHGFEAIKTRKLGALRHIFRFESATTMIKTL